jgi:lipopolysaccharide transport system permease protein
MGAILRRVNSAEASLGRPETAGAAVEPPAPGMRRIQPSGGLIPIDFAELWRYRQLSYYFLIRNIKGRYRQKFLGPLWAILRPLMTMVIFSAIFGGLAGIKPGANIPYPLFVTPGVLAFSYFSSAMTGTSASILANAGLMSKAYFPRLYAPLAAVFTPVVDLLLALTVLLVLFGYYHRLPSWHFVFLPAFVFLGALVALGCGLWLNGVTVRYRDVSFALPFAIQILQYATPVIYPLSFVPSRYRWLYALNPVTAVVQGFRWTIVGTPFGQIWILATSIAFGVVFTAIGLFVFRRTERTIVDMI